MTVICKSTIHTRKRDHWSQCGGCGSSEAWFLHTVHHRGHYRRLCTDCVLKNHQGSFCSICLHVFENSLLPTQRVMCLRCPSISHLSCLGLNLTPSFYCLSCSDPNFTYFSATSDRKKQRKVDHASSVVIDKESAKALVAAARIAMDSMSKAALYARSEAEKRVREAAFAKKKAAEALELLAILRARVLQNKEGNGGLYSISLVNNNKDVVDKTQ